MKNIFCLLFLLSGSLLFAQKNNNSVLWKISGNGLKDPSYLFGTIHAVPDEYFELSDSILKCIDKSKRLIMEADLNISLKEQLQIAKQMFLPNGKRISNYMDSTKFTQLFSYLRDSLHIKEEKLNKYCALKPIFLQSILLTEYIKKPKMYEMEMRKYAGKKKEFIALETLQEQLNVLDSIPYDQQLSFDANSYKIDQEYFTMLDAYQTQNISLLDSLLSVGIGSKETENTLLNNRNQKWMPKIEESIRKSSTFVAVGCGHVIGDDGLIQLLSKKGYSVEPIYFTINKRRKK